MRAFFAALAALARGFVGLPAEPPACPHGARAALEGAAARRGRCC
ncbi:MAG TPA: hypothetical protein VMR31_14925 [Myxococcota bacterium]|nr:hypothetical protein [Myxococcota bacterium]